MEESKNEFKDLGAAYEHQSNIWKLGMHCNFEEVNDKNQNSTSPGMNYMHCHDLHLVSCVSFVTMEIGLFGGRCGASSEER